jgi:hypothetical protein
VSIIDIKIVIKGIEHGEEDWCESGWCSFAALQNIEIYVGP